MDHALEAAKLRRRADECRTLAGMMKGDGARTSYLALAESYDSLALKQEALIGNAKR